MHYEDYIFFRAKDGRLVQIPHEKYVALMHRVQPIPSYAKQRLRVGIFYVEMDGSCPAAVVNATYNLLEFDEAGLQLRLLDNTQMKDLCDSATVSTIRKAIEDFGYTVKCKRQCTSKQQPMVNDAG